MANGQNGNGVTFQWVAGLAMLGLAALATAWGKSLENKIEQTTQLANKNAVCVSTVQAIVIRVETKVDRLLKRE